MLRGVSYDVGRFLYGDWRPDYAPVTVHRELSVIKNHLHCDAVRINSRDLDRLAVTAEDALEQGLQVWLSPEWWNKTPQQTLPYVVQAGQIAERLARKYPGQVVLSVGTEATLFMKGIIAGGSLWTRMRTASQQDAAAAQIRNHRLNDFLADTVEAVRRVFTGPITYAALPIEQVEWDIFDIIGIDHYRAWRINDHYIDRLMALKAIGKPVAVMEFGCCAYQGAEQNTSQAFAIIDVPSQVLHGIVGRLVKPSLKDVYVRDESVQASEILASLRAFTAADVDAAFVHTFIDTQHRRDPDPRHDLDLASYALVASLPGGQHGTAYPDMSWEPKQAFTAVANYYADLTP